MSDIAFLRKLHRQETLKIEPPNDTVSASYLQKSSRSLQSAKILTRAGNLEDAIALSYYAMYHALTALLFKAGVRCENHGGAIMLLRLLFDMDNTLIAKAKAERIDRQYYVDFSTTHEQTREAIGTAEDFIALIHDRLASMSSGETERLNERMRSLLGS